MIRESYEHLALLGNFFFFKIFAPIIVGSGAFNLPSTVEELPFSHLGSCNLRLRELGCSAAAKLGIDVGSVGWRVLRRLRVLLRRACSRVVSVISVVSVVTVPRPSRVAELTCSQGVSPKSAQTPVFSCVSSIFGVRRVRLSHKKSMLGCENQRGAKLGRPLDDVVIRAD